MSKGVDAILTTTGGSVLWGGTRTNLKCGPEIDTGISGKRGVVVGGVKDKRAGDTTKGGSCEKRDSTGRNLGGDQS